MTNSLIAMAKKSLEASLVKSSISGFTKSSFSTDTCYVYNISPLLSITAKMVEGSKVRLTLGLNYDELGSGFNKLSVYYRGCDIRAYMLSCECLKAVINRTVTHDNGNTLQKAFTKWIEEVCVPALGEVQDEYVSHSSYIDSEYNNYFNFAKILGTDAETILSGKTDIEQYSIVSRTQKSYHGFNYALSKEINSKTVLVNRTTKINGENGFSLALDGLTFEQSQKVIELIKSL